MNTNPVKASIALIFALVLVGTIGGSASATNHTTQGAIKMVTRPQTPVASDDLIVSGGCIRFTEDGPRWHINDNHAAIGLLDTTVEPFINVDGFLEVTLKDNGGHNANPVVSITAAPDETLAYRGIMAGGSGGVTSVRFRLSKVSITDGEWSPLNLNLPVHYSRIEGDNSNLWITMVHVKAD